MGGTTSRFDGQRVLITGASEGIGHELALALARTRTPSHLILIARRKELLDKLASEIKTIKPSIVVVTEQCDVGDTQSMDQMIQDVGRQVGTVDILVNCAGVEHYALFEDTPWTDIKKLIDTNIIGMTYLTRAFLPAMVAQRRGGIIFLGSGAGFVTIPLQAVYCATKHYINGLAETLIMDTASTGVTITQVCPGPVDTGMLKHQLPGHVPGGPPNALTKISPTQCAHEIIAAHERGKTLVFTGYVNAFFMMIARMTPQFLMRLNGKRVAIQKRLEHAKSK